MMSLKKDGPCIRCGVLRMSGDPADSAAAQGTVRRLATCDPVPNVTEESVVGSMAIASDPLSTGSNPGSTRPRSELHLPREVDRSMDLERPSDEDEAGLPDLTVLSGDEQAGACAGPSTSEVSFASPRQALSAGIKSAGSEESESETAPDTVRQKATSKKGAAGKKPSQKRSAKEGPTPPKQRKAKKPKKSSGTTFERASEKALLGVVVLAEDPIRLLTANQIGAIRNELLKRHNAATDARQLPIVRFVESGVIKGRYQVACYDPQSFSWLQSTVADTKIRIGDSEPIALKLVLPTELPKLRRAELYIPGPPEPVEDVKGRLEFLNPGLKTDLWNLRFRQALPKGTLLVWGIDPSSVAFLEGMGNHLYYGMGRVNIRVSREARMETSD